MVVSLAFSIGLMLSPASLVLLGNSMGKFGLSYCIVILSVMILQLFTANSYRELLGRFPGPGGESKGIQETLGTSPATVLPLCSRVVFTICAGTLLLARAGYTFNEVFVYWFPNLGFSFCLLGFILILTLGGRKIAEPAQVVFAGVTVFGLLFLSFAGLLEWREHPVRTDLPDFSVAIPFENILMSLLLFTGFDLAGFTAIGSKNAGSRVVAAGILVAAFVFLLWGVVSLKYVSPERLSETTVPYMAAAREVLGQPGRIVMGIVVLAGTSSALVSMLMAVCRMASGMAAARFLPSFLAKIPGSSPVPLILLAAGIAAMLGTGMAGEPALEVYAMGGFLFWLLTYAAVHLAVLRMRRPLLRRPYSPRIPGSGVIPVMGCLFMLMSFLGLIGLESQSGLLIKFMFLLLIGVSFLILPWRIYISAKERG
jgi:amino acid transporter